MATINAKASGHTIPLEILLEIFKALLPGPRVFSGSARRIDNPSDDIRAYMRKDITLTLPYYQPTLTPTTDQGDINLLLQINQASRKIVLRHYQPAFAAQLAGKPIYFNFDIDTIFFNTHTQERAMQGVQADDMHYRSRKRIFLRSAMEWQRKLKHVMIGDQLKDCTDYQQRCQSMLKRMHSLETIIVEEHVKRGPMTDIRFVERVNNTLSKDVEKGTRDALPVISVVSHAELYDMAGIQA